MSLLSLQGWELPTREIKCVDNVGFYYENGCGWEGTIAETIKEPYNTIGPLCGSKGIHYKCPNCEKVLKNEIHLMS